MAGSNLKMSTVQREALAKVEAAAGEPKSAYELRCSLATLRALVNQGVIKDVTPFGPGSMFSPRTHYQFVWSRGVRKSVKEAG